MPKLILFLVVVLSACSFSCGSPPIPEKPHTVLKDFVVDEASLFTESEKQLLSSKLREFKKKFDVQIVILTSSGFPDQGMAEFATAKGREYGNADKDTGYGILLVVCVTDKEFKSFLGPTANLQWFITDGIAGEIQRQNLDPQLRKRQWFTGVDSTINAIIKRVTPGVTQERNEQKNRMKTRRQ